MRMPWNRRNTTPIPRMDPADMAWFYDPKPLPPATLEHGDNRVVATHKHCTGATCPLHKRTNHHLRHMPQRWPGPEPIDTPTDNTWHPDGPVMQRVCTHGMDHPDPDDPDYPIYDQHPCDGCCVPPGITHSGVTWNPMTTPVLAGPGHLAHAMAEQATSRGLSVHTVTVTPTMETDDLIDIAGAITDRGQIVVFANDILNPLDHTWLNNITPALWRDNEAEHPHVLGQPADSRTLVLSQNAADSDDAFERAMHQPRSRTLIQQRDLYLWRRQFERVIQAMAYSPSLIVLTYAEAITHGDMVGQIAALAERAGAAIAVFASTGADTYALDEATGGRWLVVHNPHHRITTAEISEWDERGM